MIVSIEVDDAGWQSIPALAELTRSAVDATVARVGALHENLETAILFTDDATMARLNAQWRGKPHATNILSFPAESIPVPEGEARPLGDIVLAWGVVAGEAQAQATALPHHAAHLIVHGLLHLLGYDHQTDAGEASMQELERQILKELGYSHPHDRQ
ncbi:MAG: rRNA maturation RNase YbeY [Aestuariivirga sp.]